MRLDSLAELEDALAQQRIAPDEVMLRAQDFLRRAVKEKDPAVKQFLFRIVGLDGESFREGVAIVDAMNWLSAYEDSDLVPFFIQCLPDPRRQGRAIEALMVSRDSRAGPPLFDLLQAGSLEYDQIVGLLKALAAVQATFALDAVATYLQHPHQAVRSVAVYTVLQLSKIAEREDWLEKVRLLLNDPNQHVRSWTATCLFDLYPDRFSREDLRRYRSSVGLPHQVDEESL